jgi:5-formyltetrahydrofolate cyclo-ligase
MSAAPTLFEKSALRKTLRQVRASVPEGQRRLVGERILRLALRHRLIARGRRIGLYIPKGDELDCLPLLNRALWLGAVCYLPMLPPRRQKKLWFTRLHEGRHWSVNRFGIPEFGLRHARYRAFWLDTLFLPLLGFDARGYRMGMGGGYYDASLAYLARRRYWRRPRLIGLAFEAQRIERLPEDPWDVPLDGVLTESRFYRFRAAGQTAPDNVNA